MIVVDNEGSVGASVYVTFVVSFRPLILMCLIFVIVFKACEVWGV